MPEEADGTAPSCSKTLTKAEEALGKGRTYIKDGGTPTKKTNYYGK